jgi:hypothetical protein
VCFVQKLSVRAFVRRFSVAITVLLAGYVHLADQHRQRDGTASSTSFQFAKAGARHLKLTHDASGTIGLAVAR